MIEFDKKAPGGGVSAECRLENGKMFLEWRIALSQIDFRGIIRLKLRDADGNIVLECVQASDEEEPLHSVLLQPRLWTDMEHPYLYQLEAVLEDYEGNCLDKIMRQFPLRHAELRRVAGEDVERLFLNGERFVPKAVCYELPVRMEGVQTELMQPKEVVHGQRETKFSRCILSDLEKIVSLGVNCICVQGSEQMPPEAAEFCERTGVLPIAYTPGRLLVGETVFLVDKDRTLEDYLGIIPIFPELDEVLCRVRWSHKPMIYIDAESIKPMKSGNYTVTCYSNCKRLALYSDGKLFEFQQGREIFTFQEIPVKGPCIMLAVEGEGCNMSMSIQRSYFH